MTKLIDATARGVYPISVTPFLDNGAIDFASMDRLVDFFLEIGVPGMTLLGLLGEANKLSKEESIDLVRRVVRRLDGRAQVIAGVSQAGFDEFASLAAAVMGEGASGIMVAPAPSLKTEDQVLGFFEAISSRIGEHVPIALQDYPQNTGVYMSVDTLARIIERVPNVQIVKHEEGSALRKITKMRAQESSGGRRRVSMLVGNSGLHLPQELARGVDGANTGVAFPEILIEVCNRFFAGNPESAEDLYDIFLPVIRHEWQVGIGLAIRKEIFRRRGLIATAKARAPGPSLYRDDHVELTRLLARLERRAEAAGESGLIRSYRVKQAA
ncbi:dihydrodipicolinate synthase family protein [Bradyrhizobium sp. Cp5.3]|uniref:dihydrodipicolinate synthase family protein n=1 Tax=Bradyrhizobium sp. Cp5.3 TaxID=443598 RepID=UPI000416F95D|nr:dihydrodipicolinate synthase family protein [Bradyrhizobium sp. Cp5.3]